MFSFCDPICENSFCEDSTSTRSVDTPIANDIEKYLTERKITNFFKSLFGVLRDNIIQFFL